MERKSKSGLLGKLLLAGAVAVAGSGSAVADDLVSFRDLRSDKNPPLSQPLWNSNDFKVNGEIPTKRMVSLGFGKITSKGLMVVGYADNFIMLPNGIIYCDSSLGGTYNCNPSFTDPSDDIDCLVMGERPSVMWALYDKNDNKKFGTYSYNPDTNSYDLSLEPGEIYYNFIINNKIGPIFESELPAVTKPASELLPPISLIYLTQEIIDFKINPSVVYPEDNSTATLNMRLIIPPFSGSSINPPKINYGVRLDIRDVSTLELIDSIVKPPEVEAIEWGQTYVMTTEIIFDPNSFFNGRDAMEVNMRLTDASSNNDQNYFHFEPVKTEYIKVGPPLDGDVNGDFCVNVADLLLVKNNLGNSGSAIMPREVDVSPEDEPDDVVNVADLLYVKNRLGDGYCPSKKSDSKVCNSVESKRIYMPKAPRGFEMSDGGNLCSCEKRKIREKDW